MIMSGQRKAPEPRPYMVSEIPEVKIDYRGLITYDKCINLYIFQNKHGMIR